MTLADYEGLGGVTQSLTQRANKEYDTLVEENEAYAQIICHVMLRMIAIGGGELTRRRVPLSELEYPPEKNDFVKKVIECFTEARLLVQGQNAEENPYVEPAHDALVRGWPKLSDWIQNQPGRIALQQSLINDVNLWNQNQQSNYLWNNNPRLEQVKNSEWLNELESEFIRHSIQQRKDDLEKTEQQRDEALQGQITALAALSEAHFQNDQLGALILILKAGRMLQQLITSKSRWRKEETSIQTEVVLRKILSKVKEFNRLEDKDIPLSRATELSFTSNHSLLMLNKQGMGVPLNFISDQELILMEEILPVKDPNSQNVTRRPVIRFWGLDGSLEAREIPESLLIKWNPVSQTIAQFLYIPSQSQEHSQPQELKSNAIRLLSREGKEVILQEDRGDNLMTLAFSPNGQLIASGGWSGHLYIWKTDGTIVKYQQIRPISLNAIDFSPNSEMLATGHNDGIIRLWNQNGEQVGEAIEAHKDAIWGVSFNPDGETLASVSTDTTVKIWKTDGTLLTTLNGHKDIVRAVCWSSNGQILASASDEGTVRLWKPNGTDLKSLDDHHAGPVYTVCFSPDGQIIATTSGHGQLILWSQDGRLLKIWDKAHNGAITALSFSPNSKMFVTAAADREVKLWRLDHTDFENLERPNLGQHTGHVNCPEVLAVSFSPDNQTILLGSWNSTTQQGELEICNSETMSCKIIAEYGFKVWAVCFNPNGQMFALGKEDGSFELWRKEGEEFQLLKNFNQDGHPVIAVCFSPDGNLLATVSTDQTVKLWQTDSLLSDTSTQPVSPTITLSGHTNRVNTVRFSPDGQLIATASYDKTVKLWSLDGQCKKTLHGHNDQVNSLDFSPDGVTLASASHDKTTILWNLEQEKGLDQLIDYGCEWIWGYLTNNPNVNEDDRKVLSSENFPPLQYESHKWI
jgi:WD40 repeat protein